MKIIQEVVPINQPFTATSGKITVLPYWYLNKSALISYLDDDYPLNDYIIVEADAELPKDWSDAELVGTFLNVENLQYTPYHLVKRIYTADEYDDDVNEVMGEE